MKYFLITIVLGSLSINAKAQLPKSVSKTINSIKSTSPLNWYKKIITANFTKLGAGGEKILHERVNGASKVQVGVNQQPAVNEYVNNGSVKTQSGSSVSCTFQPKLINTLIPGNFSVSHLNTFINYPGDFINPNTIIDGVGALTSYNPPAGNLRNPYKIGLSIFSSTGNNEITVTDFNNNPQAKIQDSLLRSNFGAGIPVQGILKVMELKSELQYKANVETSAGIFLPLEELGIPLDVIAGLRYEGSNETALSLRYFAVDFFQPLYTLSLLTYNTALFANPAHTSANTGGAYISDVTYGRRASFIFAAADYQQVIDAFFEGGADVTVTEGEAAGIEVGLEASGQINTSVAASVRSFWGKIYGGSNAGSLSTYNNISNFHTAFKSYITSSSARVFGNNTGALPLFYSLRRISDGAIIGVRSVGPFDEKVQCNTNSYKVQATAINFKVDKAVDWITSPGDDIYGHIDFSNRNTQGVTVTENATPLFNINKIDAIEKNTGENYTFPVDPKIIIPAISKNDLVNTILNFSEDIRDSEGGTAYVSYAPISGTEMQVNLTGKDAQIEALAVGQSVIFTKHISLYENGGSNNAKVTFKIEVKVTRN